MLDQRREWLEEQKIIIREEKKNELERWIQSHKKSITFNNNDYNWVTAMKKITNKEIEDMMENKEKQYVNLNGMEDLKGKFKVFSEFIYMKEEVWSRREKTDILNIHEKSNFLLRYSEFNDHLNLLDGMECLKNEYENKIEKLYDHYTKDIKEDYVYIEFPENNNPPCISPIRSLMMGY